MNASDAGSEEVIRIDPKYYGKRPVLAAFSIVAALNRNEYRCYHCGEYSIYLNLSEYNTMLARAVGMFEPRKFALIRRLLKSGDVFFDIGGNKGDFSLLASGLVGPQGRVFCFEPHPENAAWIRRSVQKNQFANVEVVEACVCDAPGTIALQVGAKSGSHSIRKNPRRKSIECAAVSIDQMVRDHQLPRVDLMKIDIEGAEAIALAGAHETVAAFRPPMLIDVHRFIGPAGFEALFGFCKQFDYRMISDHSLREAATNDDVGNSMIFAPQERFAELRRIARWRPSKGSRVMPWVKSWVKELLGRNKPGGVVVQR